MVTIDSANTHATEKPTPLHKHGSQWYRRVLWLVAIWFGSVVALGVVASLFRLMMHMAGMTTH